ncbi:MAG: phosphatase PAP2 family protein [Promethearchaeota archaeon]
MESNKIILTKRGLLIITSISACILIVGLILLFLGYNEAFYSENSVIQTIFKIFTFTGEAIFLVLLVSVFFFVYDKKFAKNLAFSLLISVYINSLLKSIFKDPRPSTNIDPKEEYGLIETDYGFPSGHSQNAVATWGYIAFEFKDKSRSYIIPIIFSVLILLIALSRIILGVHDLQDIIGGLLIGIVVLLLFIYLEPIISEKIGDLSIIIKIIIAISISIILFIISVLLFPKAGLGLVKNAPDYADAGGFAQASGAILGISVGYILENEYINYQPSKLDLKWKLINLILGIFLLMGSYMILELILKGNVILRFLRYSIISFIVIFVVPLIFKKINPK